MPFNAATSLDKRGHYTPEQLKNWFGKLNESQQKEIHTELKTRMEGGKGKHSLLDVKVGYKAPSTDSDDEEVERGADGQNPETSGSGEFKSSGDEGKKPMEVTDAILNEMWNEIDIMDVSSVDPEALRVFEYQGFNPDAVLRSLLTAVRTNNIDKEQFKNDILVLCAIAVIKGSVNDHNVKKVSDEGQKTMSVLEQRYGIKRGSGRGEKPHVLTVSRIAAAFPGKVVQLIQEGKVSAKKFMGPFKTYTLPPVLRHQSFPAVVPSGLNERTKTFLLSLSIAFSVDQSINITPDKKTKPDLPALFETQRNFIYLTADGPHPKDSVRVSIFKTIILDYDSLLTCARATAGIISDFKIISKEDFNTDIAAV